MATTLTLDTMTGVALSGAEVEVVFPSFSRDFDLFVDGQSDVYFSFTSGGTSNAATRTKVPAYTSFAMHLPGTRGGQQARSTPISGYVKAASGTAAFTVVS